MLVGVQLSLYLHSPYPQEVLVDNADVFNVNSQELCSLNEFKRIEAGGGEGASSG